MHILLYFLTMLFLSNSIVLIFRGNFTLGTAMMITITFMLGVLTIFYNKVIALTQSGLGFSIKSFIIFLLIIYIGYVGFILFNSKTDVKYDEKAIIVLGTGLNPDGTPTKTLKNRLDAAIEYFGKNKNCYIVVSGSKSPKCDYTEAFGMKEYLVQNNIPRDRIILEENATNTKENFLYSKEKLNTIGIECDKIAFVTNSFHVYRSRYYGKKAGFKNLTAISTGTDPVVFIPAVIRESVAVLATFIFDI